jgi:plasmid replication initiation protein
MALQEQMQLQFEIDNMREYKVIKSNDLIQKSRFSLSTQEQKIVLYIISKIKPTDTELKEHTFSINDFCKICGLASSGANYNYIKRTIKKLSDKSIWVILDNGDETLLRWIGRPIINKKSGYIKLKLDDLMKPYLLQLQEKFTQYELIYTLAMKSQYSIRLYEILKSIQWKKTHTYDIDELKKVLGAENYISFKDFRVKVVDIAKREIDFFTDIEVKYTLEKEGRKYSRITFEVKPKKELSDILLAHKNIYEIIDPEKPVLYKKLYNECSNQ